MSYCINPWCKQRQNPDELDYCQFCDTSLLINEQFRLLEPLRPLDSDSHTEVFEVVDEKGTWVDEPGTHKVMKVLNSTNSKLIELMQREANVLSLVDTPGIPLVDIDGYFTLKLRQDIPELHCLVLEKIPGQNLQDWIEIHGRIVQSLALQWLRQLVQNLDKLHSFGFFHRDIKPTNIILRPDGGLALIDFGAVREVTHTYMAKLSRGLSSTVERSGFYDVTVIRTACYTPIEQLNGKAVPQSDFYALGCTFVYLVTGISLFNIDNDSNTGRLIWRNKAPQIDEPFADLLDEMMSPFPGQRPQNTQVILQRLSRIPQATRWNRIIKSNQFKLGSSGLMLLLVVVTYKVLSPWVANQYFNQGKSAQLANRPEAAQKDFQMAIKLNPSMTHLISSFYFEQASRHQNEPRIEKLNYELAIKYNPNDADAYNNLALACQSLNDFSCVTTNYEKAIKLNPLNWEGHYNLGSFYDEQGIYAAAEKQYMLAIQLNRKLAVNAVNNLSRLNNIKAKYDTAAALALQGLLRANDSGNDSGVQATLYKNLGWARLKQNRYAEAKTYLQKAQSLDPTRTDTYCLLAQVQSAQNDITNAAVFWDTCLRMNSELPEVSKWKTEFLKRLLPAAY